MPKSKKSRKANSPKTKDGGPGRGSKLEGPAEEEEEEEEEEFIRIQWIL